MLPLTSIYIYHPDAFQFSSPKPPPCVQASFYRLICLFLCMAGSEQCISGCREHRCRGHVIIRSHFRWEKGRSLSLLLKFILWNTDYCIVIAWVVDASSSIQSGWNAEGESFSRQCRQRLMLRVFLRNLIWQRAGAKIRIKQIGYCYSCEVGKILYGG